MADATKFKRLFDLYERFNNHGQLTVSQMMSDYGVNRRTVNRDLLDLQEIGLKLEAKEGTRPRRHVWIGLRAPDRMAPTVVYSS